MQGLPLLLVLTSVRKFFSGALQQFRIRKLPSGVNTNSLGSSTATKKSVGGDPFADLLDDSWVAKDLRRRPMLNNTRVVEAVGERKITHIEKCYKNKAN